jgi:hypothetical protein
MKLQVKFLSEQDGGRKHTPILAPPQKGCCGYIPHLVVTDTTEYLSVRLVADNPLVVNEWIVCEGTPIIQDVDYSQLILGSTFEIREGRKTIGIGVRIG